MKSIEGLRSVPRRGSFNREIYRQHNIVERAINQRAARSPHRYPL